MTLPRTDGAMKEPAAVIYVCPLAHVADTAERVRAGHLVTLIADVRPPTPACVPRGRHLTVAIDDITVPMPGFSAPESHHVRDLLNFAAGWDCRAPMLIHCHAGISRSTAAAFTILAAIHGAGSEAAIATALREAAPWAQPNARIVQLADDLLARGGAMIAAIDELGLSDISAIPRPFRLSGPFAH